MTRRSKITFIAVVAAMIISIAIFAAIRHNYSSSRSIGGEGMLLLLPVITYLTCKNITTSLDVFQKPEEENLQEYKNQIISSPIKLNETKQHLKLAVNSTMNPVSESNKPKIITKF